MLKEKLFKFLFPNQYKDLNLQDELVHENKKLERKLKSLQEKIALPFLDFNNINEEGKPPHYLKDLGEVERKNYIAGLEMIYTDEKFQAVFNYVINLIGNTSFQTAPEELMKNGRYGIIGARTFMNEFLEAHNEHLANQKTESEEFDENETLAE